MTRFLKLPRLVLNTSSILRIRQDNEVYKIFTNEMQLSVGFWFAGTGGYSGETMTYEFSKEKNPIEYDIIQKWILYDSE